MTIWLFLIGLAVGSFINVLALRYKARGPIFSSDILKGRSRCPNCGANLRWFELIPVFSFLIQLGRCHHCKNLLSWQYPIIELGTGVLFALLLTYPVPGFLWLLALLTFILIALIDLRLSVIPDQLNLFLLLLGAGLIIWRGASLEGWLNSLLGGIAGLVMTGLIVVVTRGKAMGMGDVKMASALGFLFSWPEIVFLLGISFVLGGAWSAVLILFKKKSLKEAIPFGPFLSLASGIIFFFGDKIIGWYLGFLV